MAGLTADKVIVPVDFSDESVAAVDKALEIAEPGNVHVMHVLPELHPADPGVVWQTVNNENRCKHAEQAMGELLADAKYQGVDIHAEVGDPGHRVTEYATKEGADLIVMPSHGRRGISRMLIGSVAERVLRLAHCPVLILRS